MSQSDMTTCTLLPQELLCFSHLRWKFVFQRPQHLLTRYASLGKVTYFEEPIFVDRGSPELSLSRDESGVLIATPLLPYGTNEVDAIEAQRQLLQAYLADHAHSEYVAWYYTPMALLFTSDLSPALTVYDCMDELSAFDGAPPQLSILERELFARADVVFTGGHSLFAAKREQHANLHAFPSSIDLSHFLQARRIHDDPADQNSIPHPRVGFFGVLDERLDRELLGQLAQQHSDWHFVLIGPIAKIDSADLPHGQNIHYLGQKSYFELPQYLAGWDVAILPFALNRSTRFISPTKTPEYLAAAKPVVSTPIHDVIHPYEELGLVRIAKDAAGFGVAISAALQTPTAEWLGAVDSFLATTSWDKTFDGMVELLKECYKQKSESIITREKKETVTNV